LILQGDNNDNSHPFFFSCWFDMLTTIDLVRRAKFRNESTITNRHSNEIVVASGTIINQIMFDVKCKDVINLNQPIVCISFGLTQLN